MTKERKVQLAIGLYRSGAAIRQIAPLFGRCSAAIWFWLRDAGEPRRPNKISKHRTMVEAMEARVIRRDGCWGWSGKTTLRYGTVYWEGKEYRAHRIAYEAYIGPIPEGLYVCHHCDNPPCTNPTHLFVGTHQDNVVDMWNKGRGKAGPHAITTQTQIEQIHALRKTGLGIVAIGKQVGCSKSTVWNVLQRGDG